jgi:hypothetical protein
MLPHFADNRFIDGGEVVDFMSRQAALYPEEDFWYSSEYTPRTLLWPK